MSQKRFTVKFSVTVNGEFLVVMLRTIEDGRVTVLNLKIDDEVVEDELSSRKPKKIFPRLAKLIKFIEVALLRPSGLTSNVKTISFTFSDASNLLRKLRERHLAETA